MGAWGKWQQLYSMKEEMVRLEKAAGPDHIRL